MRPTLLEINTAIYVSAEVNTLFLGSILIVNENICKAVVQLDVVKH